MSQLSHRTATAADEALYLQWANDADVRKNSFNEAQISPQNHHSWFSKKLKEEDALLLVFLNEKQEPVGQVRIDKGDYLQVDISVDQQQRGKGYALQMLQMALTEYVQRFGKNIRIFSLIKRENISSIKTFEKAGFKLQEDSAHPLYLKYIFTPLN